MTVFAYIAQPDCMPGTLLRHHNAGFRLRWRLSLLDLLLPGRLRRRSR